MAKEARATRGRVIRGRPVIWIVGIEWEELCRGMILFRQALKVVRISSRTTDLPFPIAYRTWGGRAFREWGFNEWDGQQDVERLIPNFERI